MLAPIALLPGCAADAGADGVDLSARGRPGRPLAQGQNPSLKGDASLEDAVKNKPWDESVKSLYRLPQALDR